MMDLTKSAMNTGAVTEFQPDAAVATVQAELQAMLMWAVKFPRNEEKAIAEITERCKTFAFADSAIYELKRENKRTGEIKFIRGIGIAGAREVQRRFKNIRLSTDLISETEDGMLLLVASYDLENNIKVPEPVFVSKTIERSYVKDGDIVLRERLNAKGQKLYVVRPTDEEMRVKILATGNKAVRNVLLACVPSDAQETWIEQCLETKMVEAKKQAGTKDGKDKLLRSFDTVGVTRKQLEEYLGHDMGGLTPEEWSHLRGVFRSLRDEGLSWNDILDRKETDKAEPERGTIDMADLKPSAPKSEDPPLDVAPVKTISDVWNEYIYDLEQNHKLTKDGRKAAIVFLGEEYGTTDLKKLAEIVDAPTFQLFTARCTTRLEEDEWIK